MNLENVKNGQIRLASDALEPVYRHLSDGVIIRGRDGIVLYGNPTAEKAFGVGSGDLSGRALDELIPASAVTSGDGVRQASLSGSTLTFHVCAESSGAWYESVMQPVVLPDGTEAGVLFFTVQSASDAAEVEKFYRESILLTLANNMPLGIYVLDVEREFRFARANKSFAKMFGIAHDDILGKTPEAFLPVPAASEWRDNSVKTVEAGDQTRTFRLQLLDERGFPQFIQFSENLYVDPKTGRRLILGMAEDVTAETFFHKYESANAEILRRTQQETDLKAVLSIITEIIFREFNSCRMVWMNREMDTLMDFVRPDMADTLPKLTPELREKLVGYMLPILKEKHFCEIPEIAYLPELAAIAEQCPGYPRCNLAFEIFNQRRYIGTMLIQFTERMPFPSYNLEPRLMLVDTFSAILYRIREQQNVADSKQLLEQIIDALPMSFFVMDADDSFRYTMCNRRFCRMIGRSREQVVGKTDYDFFPKQIADMILKSHVSVTALDTMSHDEIEEEIPGVGWHAFEKWLLPFRTEQGTRILIGLNHDVTEEHKLRRTETLKMNLISFLNDNHGIDEFCDYMAGQMLETMHCDRIMLLPATRTNAKYMKEWGGSDIPHVGEHCQSCPLLKRCRENRDAPVLTFEDMETVYVDVPQATCKAKSAMVARITVNGRFWGGMSVHFVARRTSFSSADIQMLQLAASLFSMAMERSLAQKEIQQRERENRLLVDNTIIPVAMFDGVGHLLRCNKPYQESIVPVEHEVKPQLLQSIMNGLRASSIQRKINGKIWQIDAHGVTDDSNRLSYIFVFAVDTTESVRRIRRQEAINSCLSAILSETDEDLSAVREVIRIVSNYFAADGGSFLHFQKTGPEILATWGFESSDQAFLRNMPKHRDYNSTDNEWMSVLESHEITVENDLQNMPIADSRMANFIHAIKMGTRCSFRLMHGDHVWGVVALYFKDPWRSFSQTDYEMLSNFQHTANMLLLKYELTQNLKAERDKAISAEKAKSFFFSCVSHDIRTPLNSIIGFSELLRQGGLPREKSVEYLGNIIFSGNTLMQLINDVLDFASLDAGKLKLYPAMCDFRRLAESVLTVVGDAARDKALFLKLDAPVELPWLNIDAQRISQILFNLIGNAVKFTQKGGITLHIRFTPDIEADADGKKKTGLLVFTVQDTGIGIEKKHFDDLLQPFVRIHTKTPTGGTGLGLSICNLMAAKMGGKITIDSEVGVGSSFSVELPRVEYQTEAPADEEQRGDQNRAPADSDLSLLLVDDAALNLKVLEALCRKLGVRKVETASSGQEALAKMNDGVFDAVLTDVWMPNMNGDVLAAEIRRNPAWRDLPIYALTADVEMQKQENPAPFTGILLKPLRAENITDLLLKISSVRKRLSGK